MFELYKITMPDGRAYIGVSKVLQIRVRKAETRAKLSAKAKSRCHPSADSLMRRAESMRATIAVRRAAGSLWSAVSHGPRGARGPYKKREITQWL